MADTKERAADTKADRDRGEPAPEAKSQPVQQRPVDDHVRQQEATETRPDLDQPKIGEATPPDAAPTPPVERPRMAAPEQHKTVTVTCMIPNGMRLTLRGDDPVHKQEIILGHGSNAGVDAEFWNRWIEENRGYAPVVSGHISASKEN